MLWVKMLLIWFVLTSSLVYAGTITIVVTDVPDEALEAFKKRFTHFEKVLSDQVKRIIRDSYDDELRSQGSGIADRFSRAPIDVRNQVLQLLPEPPPSN